MNYPFKEKLKKIFLSETSPHRFAVSCAMGTFIAFSPYLGIQTLLVFLISWLMHLNIPVTLTVTCVINNPWTMLPIVVLDYLVGMWIAQYLLHVNLSRYNPAFMQSFNERLAQKLSPYLGSSFDMANFSLWYYFIGGHIVALVAGLVAYPVAKKLFRRFVSEKNKLDNKQTMS